MKQSVDGGKGETSSSEDARSTRHGDSHRSVEKRLDLSSPSPIERGNRGENRSFPRNCVHVWPGQCRRKPRKGRGGRISRAPIG